MIYHLAKFHISTTSCASVIAIKSNFVFYFLHEIITATVMSPPITQNLRALH
jgi:hypothetical protein